MFTKIDDDDGVEGEIMTAAMRSDEKYFEMIMSIQKIKGNDNATLIPRGKSAKKETAARAPADAPDTCAVFLSDSTLLMCTSPTRSINTDAGISDVPPQG